MKRKEILPKWIRFIAWIYLAGVIVPVLFILGFFGVEVSWMIFGLEHAGSSLHPVAIWSTIIAILAATVAYGILWGKAWAMKLGIPYGYLAIATCLVAIIIRTRGGGFYIPLEPVLLIPSIISLKNNSRRWDNFDPDNNEEQISNNRAK